MADNFGFKPSILMMMPTPTPAIVTGGGTGQSTTDPYACSYEDWQTMFARDVDEDGDIDEADYKAWFQGMFTEADYKQWFQSMFADDPDEGQEWWEFYGNTGNLFP